MRSFVSAAALVALAMPAALAAGEVNPGPDAACQGAHQTTLTGSVRDSTLALVPGAVVSLDNEISAKSGGDGRFRFACVESGTHKLAAKADGFAAAVLEVKLPRGGDVQLVLQPDTVQIGVDVNGDEQAAPSTEGTGAAQTISGTQLQSLADDPDDLLRQLQQLGAASGGNPANTTISVDGFQDSSKLPPKSSIAYIKVNPDMYSAEYREPPFDGGRIEVYTKPGLSAFHGALFATNSSSWMNASDPFSSSKAPLGKQRYGFELTGPIRKGADFSATLEHRSINDYGVVNAVGLDSGGNAMNIVANVAEPQRLWVGEARVDWQLGAKNTLISTYAPNVNHLSNVGVGGTTLAEAGYDDGETQHVFRITDVTTLSAHVMHEARTSLEWDGTTDVPVSTGPQLGIAGAFTGGGATVGNQRSHIFIMEADDDAIITKGKHLFKFGTQFHLNRHSKDQETLYFNGSYQFGGGVAPVLGANGQAVGSETETITGVEQYRRALLHLPGGTPTAFTNVSGTPLLSFSQFRDALYVQDDWNVGKGVHLSSGLRWALQNDPVTLSGVTPRLGILWSPTKKGTWTLHAHAGLFATQFNGADWLELTRENGTSRVTSTVYNPQYCPAGANTGCNPLSSGTVITSMRTLAPKLSNGSYAIENIGGTRALPFGWNLSLDYYVGRLWNIARTVNVNTPLDGSPTGFRPLAPNVNLLQLGNSAQGRANVTFAGIEQHSLKRLQLFFGGVRVNLVDDSDDSEFSQPQSAYSDAGEFAHRSNQGVWQLFGNASLTLPAKIVVSGNFHGTGDAHYNITTGFDNNGDGDFNDRPQYASPGTAGAIQTRYGLLTATGGTGALQRNLGVMPWQFYLDTNIQRAFTLSRNAKAEHQQVLTVNLRSANVLNHTNVTAVGGVLGSPLFGVPYAADTGRRVEGGMRYSF